MRAKRAGTLPPLIQRPDYLVDADTGCWIWQWVLSDVGYGTKRINGRTVLAHRWMYQQANGPIPTGLTIDHLCRNRACVNPAHMEPVTHKVNVLRGMSPNAINARKTHCLRGHEFTLANTYIPPGRQRRQCRACAAERDKKRLSGWVRSQG